MGKLNVFWLFELYIKLCIFYVYNTTWVVEEGVLCVLHYVPQGRAVQLGGVHGRPASINQSVRGLQGDGDGKQP